MTTKPIRDPLVLRRGMVRWITVLGLLVFPAQNLLPIGLQAAPPSPARPQTGRAATTPGGGVALAIASANIHTVTSAVRLVLVVDSTLVNDTTDPLLYQTGCNLAPVVRLRATPGSAIYPVEPETVGQSRTDNACVATSRTVLPNTSVRLTFSYAIDSIPDGTYVVQESLTYTLQTGNPATRYRILSDGSRFDSFPTTHADAASEPIQISTGTAAPRGIRTIPVPDSSATGPFNPSILFIDYDTHTDGSDDNSPAIASQLINGLKTGSKYHNESISSANFQITQRYVEHNAEPLTSDRSGADYQAIFSKYNICGLVNSSSINFVWIGAPGTESDPVYGNKFYEWVTTGPIYTQTYSAVVPTCNRTVMVLFINYDRAISEATHSFGHYAENILQFGFGPVDYYGSAGLMDMYDQFDGQLYRYAGERPPLNTTSASCGDVHFPPNATSDYQYSLTTIVQSDCATYNPGNPSAERYVPVNVDTWRSISCDPTVRNDQFECDQQSFLMWWMQNMPGYHNTVTDTNHNQMPNWWQYLCALDTVVINWRPIVVTKVTPDSGPTAGGASVTITGDNFPVGLAVGFGLDANLNLIQATNVVRVNSTTITAITPPHLPGDVIVYVCDSGCWNYGALTNGFAMIIPQSPPHPTGTPSGMTATAIPIRRSDGTAIPGPLPNAQPPRH